MRIMQPRHDPPLHVRVITFYFWPLFTGSIIRLECEHTFCYSCTKTSFHSDLKQQIKYRNVPPELHAPFDAEKLEKLYEGKYIHVALYGCPTCGKLATKRPREHPLLRHLVDSLGRTLGLPADFAEKYVEAPRKGDIWSGIYRPQRLVSTEAGGEEAGAAV